MKTCTRCRVAQPVTSFNKNRAKKDGLQDFCRDCDNARRQSWYDRDGNKQRCLDANRARRAETKAWFHALKASMACIKCGEAHPAALDLHHRDPALKDQRVSRLMHWTKEKILAEMAKCDILCANCHRKLHWEEGPLAQRRSTPLSRERSRGQHPQGSPS